jgi:hypothetical protein
MAIETAMTGALAPKQLLQCTDIKLCNPVPGTIDVKKRSEFAPRRIHNWHGWPLKLQ